MRAAAHLSLKRGGEMVGSDMSQVNRPDDDGTRVLFFSVT